MIKKLFKWTFFLVLALILVAGILVLLRNALGRSALESWLQQTLGYEAVVGTLKIHLGEPVVTIRNVRLLNPKDLGGGRPFVDVPEIQVSYDRDSLVNGEFRARDLRLHVTSVFMTRDREGRSTQQILVDRLRELERTTSTGFGTFRVLGLDLLRFTGIERLRISVEGSYEYLDYAQMARSQELKLDVKDYQAANLFTVRDLANRYAAFARDTGLRPVPTASPKPEGPAPAAPPAGDSPRP